MPCQHRMRSRIDEFGERLLTYRLVIDVRQLLRHSLFILSALADTDFEDLRGEIGSELNGLVHVNWKCCSQYKLTTDVRCLAVVVA